MPEFDPWFTFAHDYSSHRYDCPIAEGGMANILGCTCGYAKAWAEAGAFVARLATAEQDGEALLAERDEQVDRADEAERRAFAAEARVEALSEALRAYETAIERHDLWCGHRAEAPGDGSLNHARDLARAALACPPQQRGE